MFCYVDFCLLIFINFFILAVMPETNDPITYDKTIDIVYRYKQNVTQEWISITVRLEDPFDCMKWASLKYVSTYEIVNATNLENSAQQHIHLNVKLLDTYDTSGILIIFKDTRNNILAKERLFNFNHSYTRGLNEKHICLTHCIIIFNIKKVLKKHCSVDGFFKDQCCESNKIFLPKTPRRSSKNFLKHEKDVEITNRNSKEESVEIDIFPNDPKFNYNPNINYTFKCNASRLPKNMHLLLILEKTQGISSTERSREFRARKKQLLNNQNRCSNISVNVTDVINDQSQQQNSVPTGYNLVNNDCNKNIELSKSNETSLEKSLSLQEKDNTSKIYCEIRRRTEPHTLLNKSTEIQLFLKESKTQQNTSLQQDDSFHMNEYYIGLTSILGLLCFVSVGVILYFYCKFRANNNALQDNTVYTYVTQQEVMYAQLQLDLNKSHSVPCKNERVPYTTIAGVLKPSNENREK